MKIWIDGGRELTADEQLRADRAVLEFVKAAGTTPFQASLCAWHDESPAVEPVTLTTEESAWAEAWRHAPDVAAEALGLPVAGVIVDLTDEERAAKLVTRRPSWLTGVAR
jgi:hypothetical protein